VLQKKKGTMSSLVAMNKKLESSWILSSDGKRDDDEQEVSDKKIKQFCKTNNMVTIFTSTRHPNLVSVVLVLMQQGLKLIVASPFLDPDETYVKTGVYDYASLQMMRVPQPYMICAVGSIEKVLIAGLQILFYNGKKEGDGEDYSVSVFETESSCVATIYFTFNGHDAKLKLEEVDDEQYIYMYIEE
jgi:hypothetical protein